MGKYLEKNITLKDLPKDCPFDSFLLENNEKQIEQISEFLQGNSSLLLVNGFRGSGKSEIINFVAGNLEPDVIFLHYTCFETTILDDMLLSFFETFKNYTLLGKITPLKAKIDNFNQKINSYFNSIKSPIIVVIDSFQSVIRENRGAIVDFVKHLSKFPNVKIVIASNNFQYEDFADINFERVTILALSQKIFEKYLKSKGIKQIGVLSNELYKLSKGYYNSLVLTTNIINLRKINLSKFLELYSKSYMPYPEFIIREALSIVDPVSVHLFRLLTIMRIPIHINLLNSLHLYEKNQVEFFVINSILSKDRQCLYLKDYFRDIVENQIPENIKIKLHKACVDLYNTQLPLKPLERDLMLSRQTMRNEIEYHSMFIPKKPEIYKEIRIEQGIAQQKEIQLIEQKPITDTEIKEETTQEKIKKINFIVDDEKILNNIADSIKDFIDISAKNKQLEKTSLSMSVAEIMNMAKKEEQTFNYKRAVMLYQQALTKTDDENFYTFLPIIYTKLAKAYQNLSNLYEALEYYTQAQDFYVNTSNLIKTAEIKLEIANIYYLMYKHNNAKYILSELEKLDNLPNELMIKINLACAKLTNSLNIEYNYYKKSLLLVEIGTDKTIISELYFKYALVCDEKDDPKTAAEFYKKCINIDSNFKNNPYLSMALSNLAGLLDEVGSTKASIKYYNESIEVDLANKNYNGLYHSYRHLGEIYSSIDEIKAIEYIQHSIDCAKILKEPFYIVQSILDAGDFYYLRKDFEKSYQYFIESYNNAKTSFTKDNIDKIKSRIDDIKKRISESEFEKLQVKYGK